MDLLTSQPNNSTLLSRCAWEIPQNLQRQLSILSSSSGACRISFRTYVLPAHARLPNPKPALPLGSGCLGFRKGLKGACCWSQLRSSVRGLSFLCTYDEFGFAAQSGSYSRRDFPDAAEESLLSRFSLPPPRLLPFPLLSPLYCCLGGVALPVDDAPDAVLEELPNSLSRTSSYLRCFSSRFRNAIAWRSSGVNSGSLLAPYSESSEPSSASPSRPIPAVADSTALDDCREAICGFRLSKVTAGFMSCFSGTLGLVSRK